MASDADWETLLQGARQGDQVARNELLERLRPVIRALVRRRVPNADSASNVVQVALVRIHDKLHQFQGDSWARLQAWVRRIVANKIADYWRSRKEQPERLVVEPEAPADGFGAEHHDELERVLAGMQHLPEAYRRVVQERVFEQRKFADIGAGMGQTSCWARVTFLRAIERLRLNLGGKS
jgi:RNA polymerase sigma factor (sigma-70 family)